MEQSFHQTLKTESGPRIGLALSGGGARGLVHIGVLQALHDAGIPIHHVSGTSAGAIVGSLYAAGYTPREIFDFAREQKLVRVVNLGLPGKGFANHRYLRKQLSHYLPGNSFEDLKIPFAVTVANMNSGLPETFSSGPLVDLVIASSSIPILFNPVVINGQVYLDGGLLMNLPASPLREVCDVVIGVSLVPRVPVEDGELSTVFGIGIRCFDLVALNNIKPQLNLCDVVIEPRQISRYSRFRMINIQEMYDIGYSEAMKSIGKIRALAGIPVRREGQMT